MPTASQNLFSKRSGRPRSGIALFIVVGAMAIFSVVVSQFVLLAQINQKVALDGLDQVRAYYLAKSGFKISLLRLKIYKQIDAWLKQQGQGPAAAAVPRSAVDQIWSIPFFFPIPTEIPGLSTTQKESFEKFNSETLIEGNFTSVILSESSKYNVNNVIDSFFPLEQSSSSQGSSSSQKTSEGGEDSPFDEEKLKDAKEIGGSSSSSSQSQSVKPGQGKDAMTKYFFDIFKGKFESDAEFAESYRDFRVEDLVDEMMAWTHSNHFARKFDGTKNGIVPKRAPFYSVSELHMLPSVDDGIYDLFSPGLTAIRHGGMNINKIDSYGLAGILGDTLIKEEVKEFFDFRDDPKEDHSFKDVESFYKYLEEKSGYYKNSKDRIKELKEKLKERGIILTVDSFAFEIVSTGTALQAKRTIRAFVVSNSQDEKKNRDKADGVENVLESGFTLLFMRIL